MPRQALLCGETRRLEWRCLGNMRGYISGGGTVGVHRVCLFLRHHRRLRGGCHAAQRRERRAKGGGQLQGRRSEN